MLASPFLLPRCCAPGGPLCPLDAPLSTVALSDSVEVRLRVPDDDAVMEDYIGQAHQVALAADDYDAAMLAHCQRCIADDPAYWAQLWPSALALSRRLISQPELVSGGSVVEIGSGLGLTALSAARAGASAVLATDREPRALAFAAQSAADNQVSIETASLDWSDLDAWEKAGTQVALCADVLYGAEAPAALAPLLDHLLRPGGSALLADNADRPYGDTHRADLRARLDERGFELVADDLVDVSLDTRQGDRFAIRLLQLQKSL
tara:strand:+ start:177 stop:968 length:792 start_codon:yes stop_codon:yes gene_type:complete